MGMKTVKDGFIIQVQEYFGWYDFARALGESDARSQRDFFWHFSNKIGLINAGNWAMQCREIAQADLWGKSTLDEAIWCFSVLLDHLKEAREKMN